MSNKKFGLIIGGASGMGKESAKRLIKRDLNLWLVGRNEERLQQTKKELLNLNSNLDVRVSLVDLYNKNQVSKFITELEESEIEFSHLLNAAGYFKPISFLEHTEADYNDQIEMNKSFFFITQAVAKNMISNGGGNIVNIGSMWAHQAVKATPSSSYSMQKAGLHSLTQHLAMELADFNIRVNAVAPAVVLTTIYKSFIEEEKIPDSLKEFDSFHPIGRIGTVKDVANVIEFLFSEQSSWITGEIINIDGGVMAGRN